MVDTGFGRGVSTSIAKVSLLPAAQAGCRFVQHF
jgi:hypothetical protein